MEAQTAGRPKGGRPFVVSGGSGSRSVSYLTPAIALYAVFILVPVVQAVHYSFYAWSGLGPLTDFVGLDNYREAFGDPAFRQAMGHNGILVALSLGLQLPWCSGWRSCSTGRSADEA